MTDSAEGSDRLSELKRLLAAACGVEAARIEPDASLLEYGLDSVRAVEFICAIEEAHAVVVSEDRLAELRTLQDVASYLEKLEGS